MGVSFDLFGTLVTADRPAEPARAVASELEARDVSVPDDWETAYGERHVDAPNGAEVPLPAHVAHGLASRGVDAPGSVIRRAVVAAFDPAVETNPGALEAVDAARNRGPVAVCSNCSVPELVGRTLVRSAFDRDEFDAIVTSVGCGWRKPSAEIFELTAAKLGVAPSELVHVGDDPRTDGGVERIGGAALILEEPSLETVTKRLAERTSRDGQVDDEQSERRRAGGGDP
ncbi:HAD family hydrolase [Natrialba sp. INN-245]|uniref:HAD family hydrolase n=1 Tax=Natrialba sp. INN-245 TaxID=2690967 RepID=UPI001313ACB9|nr:HAD family hydrolase [Natrialba sp. INN-245]